MNRFSHRSLSCRSAHSVARAFLAGTLCYLLTGGLQAAPPSTAPVDGLRENPPTLHAFVNATVMVAPGQILEKGTLVIRDGSIIAVSAGLPVPAGAIVHDLEGQRVYPGLMDAYSETQLPSASRVHQHWNSMVTPEASVADSYLPDAAVNSKLRRQGVVCRLVAPASGIVKGRSSIVSTSDMPGSHSLWKASVAQHVRLGIPRSRSSRGYPSSPMGAVALARQTFLDADWYPRAWTAFQGNPSLPQPERNAALEVLAESIGRGDRFVFDSANELYLLRADAFAREFSLNAIIRGSGQEYQRLEAVRATGRPLILPVNFPKPPAVDSPEAIHAAGLSELLHWDFAPENPARLHAAGIQFAFSTAELKDVGDFLSKIRTAVQRGLPAEAALAALTTVPAALLGIDERFGTITVGKSANFVITNGELFTSETDILETWVDGQRYPNSGTDTLDVRGRWEVRVTTQDKNVAKYQVIIQGKPERLKAHLIVADTAEKSKELAFSKITLLDRTLTGSLPGKLLGQSGTLQFSATVMQQSEKPLQANGRIALADGSNLQWNATLLPKDEKPDEPPQSESSEVASDLVGTPQGATPTEQSEVKDEVDDEVKEEIKEEVKEETDEKPIEESTEEKTEDKDPGAEEPDDQSSDDQSRGRAGSDSEKKKKLGPAEFTVNFPLGAFGRNESPEQPACLVFKNATLWTCGESGVIPAGTVVVCDGKIVGVGKDIPVPDGAMVIDASGKHLTPGMIDCHSHTATDGGINESSQAITAEVRIGDFINCDDTDIYRQLAGGITAVNVLHGSANPIGGQNQVIKLRWGELYEKMRFREAPAGIKFALGENVKRSNRPEGANDRYPASRMGVEQVIRDAFQAAKEYQSQWSAWLQDHNSLPPRKDLELEALSEILRGERWVHCHSYRQDEILALLRTCEEFGIRIATLQHILEGYKVADVMARHGAMGSSFSDWWAYKVEVYDAIPYNGALMHQAGIVVSFNSDDRELARHMNHEAAKAIRYGNIEPEEALKFVTLNPAKQLRIDAYVGSIEVGKHADLVLWSGPPLSLQSRCEQSWIDGKRYFDLHEDLQMRETSRAQRARLVQKVLESGQTPEEEEQQPRAEESLWPLEDEFCRARNLR